MIDQKTGIVRLFTSSKGLAILIAMACVFTLELLRVDSTAFREFSKWLVMTYVIGASAQDAAANLATRPSQPAVTVNATSIAPPPDRQG